MGNDNKKIKIKNKENGRELFYGVVAVATFIVMAVGATFAYFTASTSSANSSVRTGSSRLEMDYISYGEGWMHTNLIPVDTKVAEYSVEYQDDTTPNKMCIDDYGNEICSVYVFQVVNRANSPQDITISIVSEDNGFANLNAMAYEITKDVDYDEEGPSEGDPNFELVEDELDETIPIVDSSGKKLFDGVGGVELDPIYVNRDGVKKTLLMYTEDTEEGEPSSRRSSIEIPVKAAVLDDGTGVEERTSKLADGITMPGVNEEDGSNMKTFMIVLYIKNLDMNQNDTDSMKNFSGSIIVSTGDGSSGVSGSIGAAAEGEDDLQSNTQTTTTTTGTTEATTTTTTGTT